MNILLVGGGARAHVLATRLIQDDIVLHHVGKKNQAILALGGIHYEQLDDVLRALQHSTDVYTIISDESYLFSGAVDTAESLGFEVLGPRKAVARIEESKSWMRELGSKYNIPGIIPYTITDNPNHIAMLVGSGEYSVVKPSTPTSGKGVVIIDPLMGVTREQAIDYALSLQSDIVLEKSIQGFEFNIQLVKTKQNQFILFPPVHDYKRRYENDYGPNTGSMGACASRSFWPSLVLRDIYEARHILLRYMRALEEECGEFSGAFCGQFVKSDGNVYLYEINARFGDPEIVHNLYDLESNLLKTLRGQTEAKFQPKNSTSIYVVPKGYPDAHVKGSIMLSALSYDYDLWCGNVLPTKDQRVFQTTPSRAFLLSAASNSASLEQIGRELSAFIPILFSGDYDYRRDIGRGIGHAY